MRRQHRVQEAREEEAKAHRSKQEKGERLRRSERKESVLRRSKLRPKEGMHEREEAVTTQEECVEDQKETNSMHEKSHVSNKHMTWW